MKKCRGICLLITILCFLMLLSGCGLFQNGLVDGIRDTITGTKEVATELEEGIEGLEVGGENGEGVVDETDVKSEDEFRVFDSLVDFGTSFKEIEITTTTNGEKEATSFTFLGEETVDGESTQRVTFTAPDDSAEVWITKENEVIKAKVDGETLDFPQMYGLVFLNLSLFTVEPDLSWTDWNFSSQKTTSRNLGSETVNATIFEVRYPYAEEFELNYEVAEIGGRNMLIGMEVVQGDGVVNHQITRLIPR